MQPNTINLKEEESVRSISEYSKEDKEQHTIKHNQQGTIQDQKAKVATIKSKQSVNSNSIHESEDKLPKIYQDDLDRMDRVYKYFEQERLKIVRAREKKWLQLAKENEKRKLKSAHQREQKRLKVAHDKEQKRLKLLFDKELIRQASLNEDQRKLELWIKKNN